MLLGFMDSYSYTHSGLLGPHINIKEPVRVPMGLVSSAMSTPVWVFLLAVVGLVATVFFFSIHKTLVKDPII